MPDLDYQSVVEHAGVIFEMAGLLTMVAGLAVAVAWAVRDGIRRRAKTIQRFRQHLGRAILLGLEFLVAADIIRTISEMPSLEEVLVLGIIVLIRTFLSFTLEVELEGRWPWQQAREQGASASHPDGLPDPLQKAIG